MCFWASGFCGGRERSACLGTLYVLSGFCLLINDPLSTCSGVRFFVRYVFCKQFPKSACASALPHLSIFSSTDFLYFDEKKKMHFFLSQTWSQPSRGLKGFLWRCVLRALLLERLSASLWPCLCISWDKHPSSSCEDPSFVRKCYAFFAMRLCACAQGNMHAYACGRQRTAQVLSSGSFVARFLTDRELRSSWPQEPSLRPYRVTAGITRVNHLAGYLRMVPGDWTRVLLLKMKCVSGWAHPLSSGKAISSPVDYVGTSFLNWFIKRNHKDSRTLNFVPSIYTPS